MIETERLIFRPFTEEDLPKLIEQRSDPDVNRYLGGPARQNAEALATRLRFYMDCYDKFGFGSCAMLWRETGEMIGTAGIQPLEDTGEIEVELSGSDEGLKLIIPKDEIVRAEILDTTAVPPRAHAKKN